jgi:hypothetical protein
VIIPEQATESLTALNVAIAATDRFVPIYQPVSQTLMISLRVVVGQILGDRLP